VEAAQQAAAQLEMQRQQQAAREEAARMELARLEAQRQEAARVEAARREQEAERPVEPAGQAAPAPPQARQQQEAPAPREAPRVEPARPADERPAVVQQATPPPAALPTDLDKENEAREARLRAIGRQLDEEAAQRDAVASNTPHRPNTLPLSLSGARRARLWGHTHDNAELVEYAKAWARRIQFTTPAETVREVAKRPHSLPMVTVAIRSDGSVESVSFVASSGVAEVDEAIRRIVEGARPYPAFPPSLAREFDVVEIRRSWHFDSAVRLD
jgi:TonB family protein